MGGQVGVLQLSGSASLPETPVGCTVRAGPINFADAGGSVYFGAGFAALGVQTLTFRDQQNAALQVGYFVGGRRRVRHLCRRQFRR